MANNDIKLPNSVQETDNLGMLAPEESRAVLEKGFDDVKGKNRELISNELIEKNKLEETRVNIIQSLFDIMKDAGVDPTSLESINQFLKNLQGTNPDLAEMFETAFNGLVGDEDISQETEAPPVGVESQIPQGAPISQENLPQPGLPPPDNAGLMNKFKDLSSQELR